MRIFWGAVIFVAGVVGLAFWASTHQARDIEAQVMADARGVLIGTLHPMDVTVSGRDVILSGTADTAAELNRIVTQLDEVVGRREVRADQVTVLPIASPYASALAKSRDGTFGMSGNAPSAQIAAALNDAGLTGASELPLASGAQMAWADAMLTGKAALDELVEGSFALSDTSAILSGKARTPVQRNAAETALESLPEGFDPVVAIDVLDPGTVAFELRYDAGHGLFGTGRVPEVPGVDAVAQSLGFETVEGGLATTFGTFDGLTDTLNTLAPILPRLDSLILRVENDQILAEAVALPGLSTGLIAGEMGRAIGDAATVEVAPGIAPEDGTTRTNILTGDLETASAGYWLPTPNFEISRQACNDAASQIQAGRQILFVTGSAELDSVSMGIVNDLAGLVLYCTAPSGMRVVIGGHTDDEGDDEANYALSVSRAQSVRDALVDRGIPEGRMQAIGYGETEPIADNTTDEGRAQNRRTTFIWP